MILFRICLQTKLSELINSRINPFLVMWAAKIDRDGQERIPAGDGFNQIDMIKSKCRQLRIPESIIHVWCEVFPAPKNKQETRNWFKFLSGMWNE